jgi:hypothetical protein
MQGGRQLKVRQLTGSLLKGMILGACVYGFMKWQSLDSASSDVTSFATDACVDAASTRYNISNPKPYKTAPNSSRTGIGYDRQRKSGKGDLSRQYAWRNKRSNDRRKIARVTVDPELPERHE